MAIVTQAPGGRPTSSDQPSDTRFEKWTANHERLAAWIKANAKSVIGAVGGLAAAVISLLSALNAVHWSADQIALVSAETAAILGVVTAVVAHYWPGTAKEPVAIAATLTALVTATCTLGNGFAWWHLTQPQASALVAVVAATVGLIAAVVARATVAPVHPQSAVRSQSDAAENH